jgi:hypothetical protein
VRMRVSVCEFVWCACAVCACVSLETHRLENLHGLLARLLESVGNNAGVNALVKEVLGSRKEGAANDHHTGRAVSSLDILCLGQLHKLKGARE